MIEIGKYYDLKVVKELNFGIYLNTGDSEILLPAKYVAKGTKIGDTLHVFIYKDSENRPIATTQKPEFILEGYAFLEVKDINKYGAFLDWGIDNQLLLPYSEQPKFIEKGKRYVVKLCLDKLTDRLFASAKIDKFLEREILDEDRDLLKTGVIVNLLIYAITDLGYKSIINQKYAGILYQNDVYKKINIGDNLQGYIKTIRDDGKIDVTIRKNGLEEINACKARLFKALKDSKGFLPLNDNSPPETIQSALEMSKKSFKKAAGMLYKEGKIQIFDNGIKLL